MQLCEAYHISPAMFYKWKNELVTDKNENKKRLKELDAENLRLKKIYAELQLHSLDEVNDLLGHWYKSYNFDRPHSSIKYKTPTVFENLNQNYYFRVAPVNSGLDSRTPENVSGNTENDR